MPATYQENINGQLFADFPNVGGENLRSGDNFRDPSPNFDPNRIFTTDSYQSEIGKSGGSTKLLQITQIQNELHRVSCYKKINAYTQNVNTRNESNAPQNTINFSCNSAAAFVPTLYVS